MREDQRQRLEAINELLLEELITEADPRQWPGAGKSADKWTKQERGDRYWCKKNAAMTGALIGGNLKLLANTKEALGRTPYTDDELDDVIARAEAKAAKRLDEIASRTGYQAFAERTYGKGTH